MALDFSYVVIPLDPYNPLTCRHRKMITRFRNYPSDRLVDELFRIAGHGSEGLWWTCEEAQVSLIRFGYNWAWSPDGDIDTTIPHCENNNLTHMRIYFKDTAAALMFKLSWIKD